MEHFLKIWFLYNTNTTNSNITNNNIKVQILLPMISALSLLLSLQFSSSGSSSKCSWVAIGATPPDDGTTPTEARLRLGRGELVGEDSGVERLSEKWNEKNH